MSPTWETTTDWDSPQSETGVHHEQPSATDWAASDTVEKGHMTGWADTSIPTPTLYIPMEEDSGSTLTDVVGSNDASLTGGTLGETADLGTTGVLFDGTDDIGEIADNTSISISSGGAVSMAMLFKVSSNATDTDDALDTSDGHSEMFVKWNEYGFGTNRVGTNDHRPSVFTFGDNIDGAATSSVSLGTWYRYVGVFDANSAIKVFFDGAKEGDVASSDDSSDTTNQISFGAHKGGGSSISEAYNIAMAEVTLWVGTALTDQQAKDWMAAYV